jgi:EAL domain-containing protein (putative c-di-GMP-specific phosphodiesterase class I)
VVSTACAQLRSWHDAGVAVSCICVNVAAAEFTDPSYCDAVEAICAKSGIEPHELCLEITENVLIDDVPGALAAFDGLKRVGVQLALDDFGTGYSSLSYLKRFPVDLVKIDQTFVAGIPSEPLDEAIVTAVIGLAHGIGMTVVAEGVEEPHQRQAITTLGCDLAQGFLFARPMAAEAVPDCLEAQLSG